MTSSVASRSGAASGAAIRVRGLRELGSELRSADKAWPKELRAAHKRIADRAAQWAQAKAQALGGIHAKAAGAIKGYATQANARVGVNAGRSYPFANAAFWGMKAPSGWYAKPQYWGSGTPQHPPWVGNTWDVAVHGQGPYAINAALADHLDDIEDAYLDAVDAVTRRAFPD